MTSCPAGICCPLTACDPLIWQPEGVASPSLTLRLNGEFGNFSLTHPPSATYLTHAVTCSDQDSECGDQRVRESARTTRGSCAMVCDACSCAMVCDACGV